MKLNKKKTITKRGRDMTGTGANKNPCGGSFIVSQTYRSKT